jgi:protein-S-isoprenylcysteine O-methyltransferase Ste14
MVRKTVITLLKSFFSTAICLFLAAGTIAYWQAWVFLPVFIIPMALIALYTVQQSPDLAGRRLAVKEQRPGQTIIAILFYVSVYLNFFLSGLDHRFNWSFVPLWAVVLAEILFLAGYYLLFLVFKENKYLAHTVTVEKGQPTITTGPYAIVRHPMYLAELIMFIFAPLVLGSYLAMTANILLIVVLATRIITEENVLLRGLEGYKDYTQKTRYRLIPGIW